MADVTLKKSDFDALLRRAECHVGGPDDSVTVSRGEYKELRKTARQYALLRTALLNGGLEEGTLDILISGAQCEDQACESSSDVIGTSHISSSQVSKLYPSEGQSCYFDSAQSTDSDSDRADSLFAGYNNIVKRPRESNDKRSLFLTNLPEGIAHSELIKIIKGGRLLEMHMRKNKSAVVSFVEGAGDFLAHVKRNDIYLHNKRIEVQWAIRQFHIPEHINNMIRQGATRNMVIRKGCSRGLTEQGIREDLEHIDNLVVVSMVANSRTGDIFISTNSVRYACYARTCMLSRSLYKGLKIDWYPDECAEALPKLSDWKVKPVRESQVSLKPSKPQLRSNIYAVLDDDFTSSD